MNRLQFLQAALALACTVCSGLAAAQAPASVKILVGFPAGGAPDAVARALAEQMRLATGSTVLVENRPGASGKIAIDALLAAPADGQVLVLAPASVMALTPLVLKSARYDAVRDMAVVASVAEYGFGVSAGPASGVGDLAAFKAWARALAKPVSYATPGLGTPQHFLGAQLEKQLGMEMNHIPYRGGALAVNDVLGGQVPLLITTEQLLVPHEGQGKLKTLFITSRERNARMPQVPTAREVGLAQLESTDWFGLFAKAGMPPARMDELRAQLGRALGSAGYREAMKTLGYTVPQKQAPNFTQVLQAERAAWTERVKMSGFEATD